MNLDTILRVYAVLDFNILGLCYLFNYLILMIIGRIQIFLLFSLFSVICCVVLVVKDFGSSSPIVMSCSDIIGVETGILVGIPLLFLFFLFLSCGFRNQSMICRPEFLQLICLFRVLLLSQSLVSGVVT